MKFIIMAITFIPFVILIIPVRIVIIELKESKALSFSSFVLLVNICLFLFGFWYSHTDAWFKPVHAGIFWHIILIFITNAILTVLGLFIARAQKKRHLVRANIYLIGNICFTIVGAFALGAAMNG